MPWFRRVLSFASGAIVTLGVLRKPGGEPEEQLAAGLRIVIENEGRVPAAVGMVCATELPADLGRSVWGHAVARSP